MKWNKPVLLSTVALLGGIWYASGSAHASAQETDVKVQVNSSIVSFPDAQPFIDENSTLQVPLRFVAEKLGNQVDWSFEGKEVNVTLKGDGKTLNMKTGEEHASVNGEKVSFGSKAIFKEGRTYVPLRFVTETFGNRIQWDDQNDVAIIDADGQYHSPAWYKPKPQVKAAAIAPEPVPLATQIINSAKSLLGIPYVWGGETPDGFDCSGFVNFVYGPKGVWLPRTSLEMYYTGTAVTNLQPGDLVFFSIGNKASHVGIYIGNNQFVSATTSRGTKIDSLSSSYWGSKYIGARRVF
ncbi:stalk domain-containing protein [Paenibacillus filicis]|uniref:Stalk domain-containing protein n=1 Tax=Paenibacillus gyeongsangnamensis TaxID=3388067 RepID=A0ABT4Q4R1_9BACL|nr:NlpC/P60 family protein [Paenibacillus filicis]MCZ8511854.1 stalk domain-containing protein [Paenibacillus filicis]